MQITNFKNTDKLNFTKHNLNFGVLGSTWDYNFKHIFTNINCHCAYLRSYLKMTPTIVTVHACNTQTQILFSGQSSTPHSTVAGTVAPELDSPGPRPCLLH